MVAKGAIPIPGAKNKEQAEQNAAAIKVLLAPDEVEVAPSLAPALVAPTREAHNHDAYHHPTAL